ncbi:hypothetical protein K438DRAFT_1994072 [Mycena galopus ATCC 62051]|nr:hypothetical protein K438DRAFT_1994072 [Mycena galopus ATCC 62051]
MPAPAIGMASTSAPQAPAAASNLPRRRRRILRSSVYGEGVHTKPTIKRLARRAGVKRLGGLMYEETRGQLILYMQDLMRDVVLHTTHDYRTTISANDIVHTLRRSGKDLYGFGA